MEIQYSALRTPESGGTKTSQEICTHRALFTIWSYYLVAIICNINYVPAQVGEIDAS